MNTYTGTRFLRHINLKLKIVYRAFEIIIMHAPESHDADRHHMNVVSTQSIVSSQTIFTAQATQPAQV